MINLTKVRQLIEKEDEGPTLDYKEDLILETDGDKAQFVKDVISLANSGETVHIISGVEDVTRKLVGIKTRHKAEQLNQILKDKCDPPLSIEYAEKRIMGYTIGVIEIRCENPPYVVSVPDKFGGRLSSNPNKSFHIERGTVFIRNYNRNEGAKRADLDKIYEKTRYVSLQADVQMSHEVAVKPLDDLLEVDINFFLHNVGEVVAGDTLVWIQFNNVKKIIECKGHWRDMSAVNDNVPTIGLTYHEPIAPPIRTRCWGVVFQVEKHIQQIEARVIIGASNMRTKDGPYVIPLKEIIKTE